LFFVVLTLAGGGILGIGPAFHTISTLIHEDGLNYEHQSFRSAWRIWRSVFVKANKQFYLFFLLSGFLVYNLYLATQIQGLIWLMISFVLVVVSGLSILLYLLSVVFDTSYEISLWNNLKLSFVCLFLHMATFLKLLVGIASIFAFTWMMKGLLLFGTFSLLILWCHVAISQEKTVIDRDLAHD